MRGLARALRWLFGSRTGARGGVVARWIFLRALAGIYFSAFYSLWFQIRGLNGPQGILPARSYLTALAGIASPMERLWQAPTLFWLGAGAGAMMAVVGVGLAASVLAFLNLWPRGAFFVCFVCFLSFVASASDFASYQSDGMLLEAGFLSLFFAPGGLRPGWAEDRPPSRAGLWLLRWEWFRIYFESGLVKILSGDPQWRNLTAMDEYYQNGPLPTWIGWYVEHLPHWFHAGTVVATLLLEFVLVWMLFFPRLVRLICFLIVTPWEIGVILTANYAFLNYLVLSLGFLLVDDSYAVPLLPERFRPVLAGSETNALDEPMRPLEALGLAVETVALGCVAYVTLAELILMVEPRMPLPRAPIRALAPSRIANQYGLFAVMTRGRYEIEFQGSNDGQTWTAYPFRYKPQAVDEAPGIYAPYQPRFDWNLWFASLGDWQQNDIVPLTEEALLRNDADVLALFRGNPFAAAPPKYVRAVLWRYWFTSMAEERLTGNWWERHLIGLYAPELTVAPGGRYAIVAMPGPLPPHD
jgi:hypothetical protein